MRKMSLILAALAALVSCSKNYVVDERTGESINFRPLTGIQSKATEKTAFASDDVIDVHAQFGTSQYFKDSFIFGQNGFNSAKPYFWPEDMSDAKPLIFNAFYNAQQTSAKPGELVSYAPDSDVAKQKDVLFAKLPVSSVTDDELTSGVVLNFRHALSEVAVAVKNSNSNLSYDIEAVKIAFISKQGDFTAASVTDTKGESHLPGSCWVNQSDADASKYYEKSSVKTGSFDSAKTTALGEPWMLVPQVKAVPQTRQYTSAEAGAPMNGPYVAVKMKIKNAADGTIVKGNNGAVWCCWPAEFNFTPGYRYTFIIDLAEGGYYETNQSGDEKFDPVIKQQAIMFSAACTIDSWENKQ